MILISNGLFASCSNDKTIKIWNQATTSLVKTLTGHTEAVRTLSLQKETGNILSGSEDKTIKIWNVNQA